MCKPYLKTVVLVLILVFYGLRGAHSQGQSIQTALQVKDNAGHSVTVQFGINSSATYCIDPSLGEFELPPGGCIGPSMCVSLKDVRTGDGACLGEGLLLDLRPYSASTQIDTYRVSISIQTYPVVLRWAPDLAAYYDSMKIVDGIGGILVAQDMLAGDSLLLDSASVPDFFIIASGPRVVASTEAGMEYGLVGFGLFQNYPNPFNPSTRIEYELVRSGPVSLSIYDLMGREVESLVAEPQLVGHHSATWNANRFPAGAYFAVLKSGRLNATRPLLLLK